MELQNTYFAYARTLDGKSVITTVNNGDNEVSLNPVCGDSAEYVGALSGERVSVNGGRIQVKVKANSGEIWIPAELYGESPAPIKAVEMKKMPEVVEAPAATEPVKSVEQLEAEPEKAEPVLMQEEEKTENVVVDWNKPYEDMSVEELQEAILEKMGRNGPVTDYMLGTVRENTHHGSLVSWVRSFG